MTREQAINILLDKIRDGVIVATTGKTCRELFELREERKEPHHKDFLNIGAMGCVLGIGLGIALNTKKKVFVFDGDGSALMKMGSLTTVGYYAPKNLVHIILDNKSYDSTGGQPTASATVDWKSVFRAANYQEGIGIDSEKKLKELDFDNLQGPVGVAIIIEKGSRSDLGRPTEDPCKGKKEFMNFFKE